MSERVQEAEVFPPSRGLVWWLLRQNIRWAVPGVLIGIAWRLLTFAPPVALGRAIDRGVIAGDTSSGLFWVGIAAGLALLTALISGARHWFAAMGYFSSHNHLRMHMLDFVQSLDLGWHAAHPRGEVLSRANADTRQAADILDLIPSFAGAIVSLVVTAATLALVSVELAIIAAATLPAVVLIVLISGRRIWLRATSVQQSTAELTGALEETLAGIVVVKSLGAEEARMQVLEHDSDAVRVRSTELEQLWGLLGAAAAIVPAVAIAAALWVGGNLVADGGLTIGELAAFVAWMLIYQDLISNIGSRIADIIRSLAAIHRLEEVLIEHPREWLGNGEVPPKPAIALEAVTVRRGRRLLLDHVSLEVPYGERLAIAGTTGVGKSTLLGVFSGLVSADEGGVSINDQPIIDFAESSLRRNVILVGDEAFVFEDSVRANLTLGNADASDEGLWRALRLAAIDELVAELDGGLDASIGHTGREVSGGEMQRLCLARALVVAPAILLLDDALSAVDQLTEAKILRNLQDWPGTVIFTSNRPLMRSFATRTLQLKAGRLVAPDVVNDAVAVAMAEWSAEQPEGGRIRIGIIDDDVAERRGAELALGEDVSGVLGRAWPMLKPFVPRMAVAALFSILTTACILAGPQIIKRVVDDVLVRGDTAQLGVLAGAYVAIGLVAGLAYYAFISFSATAGESALHRIRVSTWGALHLQPLSFFESVRTGELLSRCTDDIQHLSYFVRSGLERLVTTAILVVMGFAFMLATSWQLTLVGMGIMALNLVALYGYARFSPPRYASWGQAEADAVDSLNQAISGVSVTQAFGARAYSRARAGRAGRKYVDASRGMTMFENFSFFPIELVGASTAALVAGAGILMVGQGLTSAGAVVAMSVYVQILVEPLGIVTEIVGATQKARVSLARLLSLQELPSDEMVAGDVSTLPQRGVLQVSGVSFAYQSDRLVLDDVSFSVEPGRQLALVGPTGAGKSTLAKLIAGLERPHRGRVAISGADLHDSPAEYRRRAVAYIPQTGHLFSGTVAQNLRLASPEADDAALASAVEAAGITEFVNRLPVGIESPVGRQGGLLSAGERQLIALARLALRDPAVIILDESTSRIDDETEIAFATALRRIGQGRSLIVIAHRPSTIALADDTLELRDGRLRKPVTTSSEFSPPLSLHDNFSD